MDWHPLKSRFLVMASLAAAVTVGWQPHDAEAQERLVRAVRGDPDTGYLGMGFGYEGPLPLNLLVARARGEDEAAMPSYPKVSSVSYCTPAHRAGIRVGDEIVEVDGRDGKLAPLFKGEKTPGTTHNLVLRRGEETIEVQVTRIERPQEPTEPAGERSREECPDTP